MKQLDRESMGAALKLGFFFAFTGLATLEIGRAHV